MADGKSVPAAPDSQAELLVPAAGQGVVHFSSTDSKQPMTISISNFPAGLIGEGGDDVKVHTNGGQVTSVEKGKVNDHADTVTTEGTVPAVKTEEAAVHEKVTVEVCVKMVVCRKFITKKVNSKTGTVTVTSVRMEEDPPTVMSVHSYDTTTNTTTTSATTTITNSALPPSLPLLPFVTPAPTVKRRPGRPRKNFPLVFPTRPVPPLKAAAVITHPEADDDSSSQKAMTAESTEPNSKPGKDHTTNTDTSLSADREGDSNTKTSTASAALSAAEPAGASISSAKGDEKETSPVKRGRGRPPRAIKKPRKYLDSYTSDLVKAEPGLADEVPDTGPDDDDEDVEVVEEGEVTEINEEEDADLQEAVEEALQTLGQRRQCPKCGKRFTTSSNCHRHMAKDRCNQAHQCGFCDKLFSTRVLLERHVDSHRDQEHPDTFRCSDCNRTYATRNGYLKHKRQGTCYKRDVFHEDGTQGEFECDLCRTHFTTEKLLRLHKEKVHENPSNEYKCPDCGRIFYSKIGYNKHTAKKSCTLPYVCKVCGKRYSNKAKESYKSHMRYHLAEASGVQYQCEDCGRVYMTDVALKKHRLSHSNKRPYKCNTCGKTFPMRYMVRDHERIHTGEKPFLCNLCGTSFGNRGHLYRHMRSHQLGTLHKRGRPRKFPQSMVVKISKEEAGEDGGEGSGVVGEMMDAEGGGELGVGVVEIKADPLRDVQDEINSSMMGSGPTYITVHTVDGQLADQSAVVGDGQFQHVVMETADGVTDNVVLQVIRDLTGATAVYQQVNDSPGVSPPSTTTTTTAAAAAAQNLVQPSATAAAGQHQFVVSATPHAVANTTTTTHHPPQIIMAAAPHGSHQPQQIIVSAPQHQHHQQFMGSAPDAGGQQPQRVIVADTQDKIGQAD